MRPPFCDKTVCLCASLLTAGFTASSCVRTPEFILSSSRTELSPRRHVTESARPFQATRINVAEPRSPSCPCLSLAGEGSVSLCHQRDHKEYAGLWMDRREDQRRRGAWRAYLHTQSLSVWTTGMRTLRAHISRRYLSGGFSFSCVFLVVAVI